MARLNPRLVFAAVFVAGIFPTVFAYRLVEAERDRASYERAVLSANSHVDEIRARVTRILVQMETMGAILSKEPADARGDVFQQVAPLLTLEPTSGLIELAVSVRDADREAFERRLPKGGKIKAWSPDGPTVSPRRSTYTPLERIYPLRGNEGALGLDLTSEPRRAEAVNKAAETGIAQCSDPIVAVQDPTTGQPLVSTLIVQPFVSSGESQGFIVALFRLGSLGSLIALQENKDTKLEQLLMSTRSGTEEVWAAKNRTDPEIDLPVSLVGDRQLHARFSIIRVPPVIPSYAVLVAGLILTLFIALLASGHARRVALMEEHRRELKHLAAELITERADKP